MHGYQVASNRLLGVVVDGHRITRVLGEGGMGAVFVARHEQTGVDRAVKVIHDDVKSIPSVAKRFFREAKVLTELSHPNIVDVISYGHLENGWPYLILELIDGGDLSELLFERGAMSLSQGLKLLANLAWVLAYAHGRGIVHRDLKPANLLLRGGDPNGLKVIDFGLVRLLSAEKITALTQAAQIMGSPEYMAPEQANAFPDVREPADVYAWAGIAYAVLSGHSVFGVRPPLALIYAQSRETPPRLSQRIEIPAALDDLLYACLAKDPSARPTAPQLVSAIEDLAGQVDAARFAKTVAPPPVAAATLPPLATAPPAGAFATGSGTAPANGITEIIFADPNLLAKNKVRDALSRQMLAVVLELADALAPDVPDIASRRRIIADVESQLEEVEVDAALLDAEIATATVDERVDLEGKRAQLAERTGRLKQLLDAEQRQLSEVITRDRSHGGDAARLFGELDQMLARARALDGGVK